LCDLKGLLHDADFFIPIDRPDLGDGPLTGINFGRCTCAEKQAFYVLSCMLKRGTNAQFRYEIALAVGVKIKTQIEPALSMAVDTDRAALTVSAATDTVEQLSLWG